MDDQYRQQARTIRILASYEWDAEPDVPVRNQRRWKRLKELVKPAIQSVETRAQNSPGPTPLQIEIARLRGRHGTAILPNLRARLSGADVVIVDVASERNGSEYNPNVMIELGMALFAGKSDEANLFILKPDNLHWPSDLAGIFFTAYTISDDQTCYQLKDQAGFLAALTGRLVTLARSRGMIKPLSTPQIDYEDDPPGGIAQ